MLEQLKAELNTDPEKLGYAQLIAGGRHKDITALINRIDENRTALVPESFATVRTLVAKLGPGGAVTVKKLRAFAASPDPENPQVYALHATVQEMLPFISQGDPARGDGVDLGDAGSRALFSALVGVGVITQEEAAAVLSIGTPPCSRAYELFGRDVSLNEISEALNNG
jgi:hypothetical protein